MSHGASTHPSLCPPAHGHPPAKVPWVLLDLHAYVADRENSTSAYAEMSNGKAIRATFCTAPPPLVSYICVWCPDLPPTKLTMEPTVEVVEADLVLFPLSLSGYPNHRDHFVYKASGGGNGRPSLWRVDDADCYMLYRHSSALLTRHDGGDGGEGGPVSPQADDDGHFYIAALNLTSKPSVSFDLCLYDSMDRKWASSPVLLAMPCFHITAKVIALGEGGLMGFFDPWRGIVVLDLLGSKREHYLALPRHLVRFDKLRDEHLLYRDIAFVNGRVGSLSLICTAAPPGGLTAALVAMAWIFLHGASPVLGRSRMVGKRITRSIPGVSKLMTTLSVSTCCLSCRRTEQLRRHPLVGSA